MQWTEVLPKLMYYPKSGKVAVSRLKIVGLRLGLGLAARILSHKTATLPKM